MKTLFCSLMAFLILFSSCSKDEPEIAIPTIDAPLFALGNLAAEADFHTAGSLPAPSIRWGGEEGSFSLSPAIAGITVNQLNGAIQYDETIAIGENTFSLIAKNSGGQSAQEITITHLFSGSFAGEYTNGDNNSFARTHKAVFNKDGAYMGEDNGESDQTTEGTWTLEGNVITAEYEFSSGRSYIIRTTMVRDAEGVTLDGSWYSDVVDPSNFGGYIRFEKE